MTKSITVTVCVSLTEEVDIESEAAREIAAAIVDGVRNPFIDYTELVEFESAEEVDSQDKTCKRLSQLEAELERLESRVQDLEDDIRERRLNSYGS